MKASLSTFWERHPALFYGLALYLGFLFILQTPWALLPFVVLLFHKKYVFPAAILFLFPIYLIHQFYHFPSSKNEVEGLFYIDSVQNSARFGSGWNYKGILKTQEGKVACSCFSKNYHNPNAVYYLKGSIRPLKNNKFLIKTKEPWKFTQYRFTLIEKRNQAQAYVKGYINKHIPQKRASTFLHGMITGQLDDRLLMQQFNQLGLSHLMAVSGLHFSLLALAFHLILRLFLPQKLEAACLMVLLTLYFLFVGDSPSILRTWVTFMVVVLGRLLEKRSSALNALGVALFASLIWNPLSACSLSFQLSFLATAGILFFYAPCEWVIGLWLPKSTLKEVTVKHWLWQHGYILISLLREALALTCAVHIAIFFLLLHTFHFVSLNSLIYNLFFPFLASIALLLFLVCIPLGHWAHVLNGHYCEWILHIPETPPIFFKAIYLQQLPVGFYGLFFTLLLIMAITLKIKKKSTNSFSITNDSFLNHF